MIRNFINFITLKTTVLQDFTVFVEIIICAVFFKRFFARKCFFIPNTHILQKKEVWFLCKTNLGKFSLCK